MEIRHSIVSCMLTKHQTMAKLGPVKSRNQERGFPKTERVHHKGSRRETLSRAARASTLAGDRQPKVTAGKEPKELLSLSLHFVCTATGDRPQTHRTFGNTDLRVAEVRSTRDHAIYVDCRNVGWYGKINHLLVPETFLSPKLRREKGERKKRERRETEENNRDRREEEEPEERKKRGK